MFRYKPSGDRYELGISTPEQLRLAWQYGHNRIILMDGTFNVTEKNVLLFIIMVLDELWRGLPVAYILFTAEHGAKKADASYSAKILEPFLQDWRDAVTAMHHAEHGGNDVFTPAVSQNVVCALPVYVVIHYDSCAMLTP